MSAERLIMIEEGDTTLLTEVAQLCNAIEMSVPGVLPDVRDPQKDEETQRA